MSKFFREPLVHFFILGAVLFAFYAWNNEDALQSPAEIVVSGARIQMLQTQFVRARQRTPTESELRGLLESWIREEVLYREGIAMGLDLDDVVVRRRIAQKMEFITDGLLEQEPDEQNLQSWLDTHQDDYRIAPSYSLRQIYFDPQHHADQLDVVIANALISARDGDIKDLGDSISLPHTLDLSTTHDVERIFGQEFALAIAEIPVGEWMGSIRSGFGVHLVYIEEKSSSRIPELSEVRKSVERDFNHDRTSKAKEAFYMALRNRYNISYDGRPWTDQELNLPAVKE